MVDSQCSCQLWFQQQQEALRLSLQLSIHHLYRLFFTGSQGCWSRSQLSLGEQQGTPWTGRQSVTGPTYRDRQPLTLILTSTGNLESPINLHVFGSWEEAAVPRENSCRDEENMQTPHRRAPVGWWVWTQNTSTVATVLATAPPCRPSLQLAGNKSGTSSTYRDRYFSPGLMEKPELKGEWRLDLVNTNMIPKKRSCFIARFVKKTIAWLSAYGQPENTICGNLGLVCIWSPVHCF